MFFIQKTEQKKNKTLFTSVTESYYYYFFFNSLEVAMFTLHQNISTGFQNHF